jgi:acyl carrier protein
MQYFETMTSDEIFIWLTDMLHQEFELDKALITRQANLYTDLDIDSIDAVDLAVKLRKATGKQIEPDIFKAIRTIEDVINALVGSNHH